MPGPNYELDKGFVVDAASGIFTAQKLAAKEHVTQAGAGDQVIGILQETVLSTDPGLAKRVCAVRIDGISRAIASAAISIGARVVAAATGQLVTAAATTAKQNQVGIALTAATNAGDHFDVLLTPGVQIDT